MGEARHRADADRAIGAKGNPIGRDARMERA